MRWSDVNLKPNDRMLRQFALLCLVVFGALAAWQWSQQHRTAAYVFGALVFRLMNRDALLLQRGHGTSYWRAKPRTTDLRRYFRQF